MTELEKQVSGALLINYYLNVHVEKLVSELGTRQPTEFKHITERRKRTNQDSPSSS